ncbi:MAG: cupin domain-containing protein [Desulfobaccales bacterium]
MAKLEVKSLEKPEEVKSFPKGKVELVTLGGASVARIILEPGWKWSEHVKPLAQTTSCQTTHLQYHLAGTFHVVMEDGSEAEMTVGDVSSLPPGHDAWVVGNERVILIDFRGMMDSQGKK